MRYTTLFFDLDDTLYSSSSGLWAAIRNRIGMYLTDRLGLPEDQAKDLRNYYFLTYGTTLRGLQIHHGVDADDYLAYVHDLPLTEYIHPQPELRRILQRLPQQCWIFTNADAGHARRVLSVLELESCFCDIIDIHAIEFNCKPEPAAFRLAMEKAGEVDPRRCVFLDDSPSNIKTAHELGFWTILIGPNGQPESCADIKITSLLALPEAMPELWESNL